MRCRQIQSTAADEVKSGQQEKTGAKLADARAAIGLTSTAKVPSTKILDLHKTSWWELNQE